MFFLITKKEYVSRYTLTESLYFEDKEYSKHPRKTLIKLMLGRLQNVPIQTQSEDKGAPFTRL